MDSHPNVSKKLKSLYQESKVCHFVSAPYSSHAIYRKLKIPTHISEVTGSERAKLLLRNVTQFSEIYTVGPLDFCGVAEIVYGPGGTEVYVLFLSFLSIA